MKCLKLALIPCIGLLLGGCMDTYIHRPFAIGATQGLAIDAGQRVVFQRARPETNEQVLCAEPSPDSATAIAQSASAALRGAASNPLSGLSAQAAGEFARGAASSVTQLAERTPTIQLVRDVLYRACEAYANGALDQQSYGLILARFDAFAATLAMADAAASAYGRQSLGSSTSTITITGNSQPLLQFPTPPARTAQAGQPPLATPPAGATQRAPMAVQLASADTGDGGTGLRYGSPARTVVPFVMPVAVAGADPGLQTAQTTPARPNAQPDTPPAASPPAPNQPGTTQQGITQGAIRQAGSPATPDAGAAQAIAFMHQQYLGHIERDIGPKIVYCLMQRRPPEMSRFSDQFCNLLLGMFTPDVMGVLLRGYGTAATGIANQRAPGASALPASAPRPQPRR